MPITDVLIDEGGAVFNVDAYNELIDAITDAATDGGSVHLPAGTYVLTQNLTVPANVQLIFMPGAVLEPDEGIDIEINGFIQAGCYKIFDLAEDGTTLKFGPKAAVVLNAAWFGALPGLGGTLDTAVADAFDAFFACYRLSVTQADPAPRMTLWIPPGEYHIGHGIWAGFDRGGEGRDYVLNASGATLVATDGCADSWVWDTTGIQGGTQTIGLRIVTPSPPELTYTVSGDDFTSAGHGLAVNNIVRFTRGTPPGNFFYNTAYYVVSVTGNNFELSATQGGSPRAITSQPGATSRIEVQPDPAELPLGGILQARPSIGGTVVTSGKTVFEFVEVRGSFKLAAWLNYAAEECRYWYCTFTNEYALGEWAYVSQSTNFYNVESINTGVTLASGQQSNGQQYFFECAWNTNWQGNGDDGGCIHWLGVKTPQMIGGFINPNDSDRCEGPAIRITWDSAGGGDKPQTVRIHDVLFHRTWNTVIRIDGDATDIVVNNTKARFRYSLIAVTTGSIVYGLELEQRQESFERIEYSVTSSSPTFTSPAHGMVEDEAVQFVGNAPPTPFAKKTNYYVMYIDDDHFQLSSTTSGSAITVTAQPASGSLIEPQRDVLGLDAAASGVEILNATIKTVYGLTASGVFQGTVELPSTASLIFDDPSQVHATIFHSDNGEQIFIGKSTALTDGTDELYTTPTQIERNGIVLLPATQTRDGWYRASLASTDSTFTDLDRYGITALSPVSFLEDAQITAVGIRADTAVTAGSYEVQLQRDTNGNGTFSNLGSAVSVVNGKTRIVSRSDVVYKGDRVKAQVKAASGLTPTTISQIAVSIETRPGPAWTPAELDLLSWGEADKLGLSGGASVASFGGLAGSAVFTATAQPTLQNNIFGSLPGVQFDGTDDFMESADPALVSAITGTNAPFSLYLVLKLNSVAAIQTIFGFFDSSATGAYWRLRNNADPLWVAVREDDADLTKSASGGIPDTTDPHIISMIFDGADLTMVDGDEVMVVKDQAAGTCTFVRAVIGATKLSTASGFAQMYLGALILCAGAHDEATQQRVRDYLDRWL